MREGGSARRASTQSMGVAATAAAAQSNAANARKSRDEKSGRFTGRTGLTNEKALRKTRNSQFWNAAVFRHFETANGFPCMASSIGWARLLRLLKAVQHDRTPKRSGLHHPCGFLQAATLAGRLMVHLGGFCAE